MLFNSIPFLFVFLPVVLAGFFIFGRRSQALAAQWLVIASFFFYGWWDLRYILLLVVSIGFNFYSGAAIVIANRRGDTRRARTVFTLSVAANLCVLGYYKYANFFAANLAALSGLEWHMREVVLPLGISFFTFTQIAFLADCRRGLVEDFRLAHYALFVTYFPHLIAGPVLHHKEMMPQFARGPIYRPTWENFAVGGTIFAIGLFKKVVLADGIAPFVGPVFAAAAEGRPVSFLEANLGALSYTLQLYFDFSGYSDMAIGLSRLFGIVLPLNFNSPYKATNIIEFWRRWHMTLSRFLRDYLYVPLGGNRKGPWRRHGNLMATMLLGGLWHGAAWTFVVWGGIHGLLLVVNHGWHAVLCRLGRGPRTPTWYGRLLGGALTFYLVVIAWVFFRADSLAAAMNLIWGMFGLHGVLLPLSWERALGAALPGVPFVGPDTFIGRLPLNWLPWLLAIIWLLPNTQQFMRRYRPALDDLSNKVADRQPLWQPTLGWALAAGLLAAVAVMKISMVSEFLYFQF